MSDPFNAVNGLLRYQSFAGKPLRVHDFADASGTARMYFGPGQEHQQPNSGVPDARSNLVDLGFPNFSLAAGHGSYKHNVAWPVANTLLSLPRVVRFSFVLGNISNSFVDPYGLHAQEVIDRIHAVQAALADVKNLYVYDIDNLTLHLGDSPVSNQQGGAQRFVAGWTPRLADLNDFLGADVLTIVFYPAYVLPFYWVSSSYIPYLLGFTTTPYGAFVSDNQVDISNYQTAYPLFRRSSVWLYLDPEVDAGAVLSSTTTNIFEHQTITVTRERHFLDGHQDLKMDEVDVEVLITETTTTRLGSTPSGTGESGQKASTYMVQQEYAVGDPPPPLQDDPATNGFIGIDDSADNSGHADGFVFGDVHCVTTQLVSGIRGITINVNDAVKTDAISGLQDLAATLADYGVVYQGASLPDTDTLVAAIKAYFGINL